MSPESDVFSARAHPFSRGGARMRVVQVRRLMLTGIEDGSPTEIAFREAEERYRSLFNASDAGFLYSRGDPAALNAPALK